MCSLLFTFYSVLCYALCVLWSFFSVLFFLCSVLCDLFVLGFQLVSYPARWSFSFTLGPLHWSSSWQKRKKYSAVIYNFSVCFIFLLCSLFFVLLLSALCSLPCAMSDVLCAMCLELVPYAMCLILMHGAADVLCCSVLGAPFQLPCAISLLLVFCVFSMSRSTMGATGSKLLALQCNLS